MAGQATKAGALVAIVGPTAVGKSKLALELAQLLDGEIVNADSRQIYRYMDIGTAKPTPAEQALVPHHLIDVVNPDESFNLALYQQLACQAIEDILERGKTPLLVGGSGLYIWSVIEGWEIPPVPPDPYFRHELEEKATKEGCLSLYRELQEIDPRAAEKIDPRNIRRVIRALEVWHKSGITISQLWQKRAPSFSTLLIGLTTARADLYRRIDSRVDFMIESGLIQEVQELMEKGYPPNSPALSGIGYKQIREYLQGVLDLPTAIQQIKCHTHRLARHQYAWLRPSDERIHWLDIREIGQDIVQLAQDFVTQPDSGTLQR